MAQSARVIALNGQVLVISEAGQPRLLAVGDSIELGETVRPSAGAVVQLSTDDGQTISLGGDQSYLMGADAPATATAGSTANVESIVEALQRGGDLGTELEATAAGLAGGGAGGDGNNFVQLTRITEGVSPLSYAYALGTPATIDTVVGTSEPVPVAAAIPVTPPEPVVGNVTIRYVLLDQDGHPVLENGAYVYLDGKTVTEGTPVAILVTVDAAPTGSGLVLELSNGNTLTIPVGQTSALEPVAVRIDDPNVQVDDHIDMEVLGGSGGQFDTLNVDQSTAVTVVDDSDVTQVTLTAPTELTEGGTVVYTASVNNVVTEAPLVITLSNGAVITIPVGQMMADSAPVLLRADDDYLQGNDSLKVSIQGSSGGNYEALDLTSQVVTTVKDDGDTSMVSLNAVADKTEDGVKVTYTASVNHAPQASDLVLTVTVNGVERQVTIAQGQSSATFDVSTRGDDIYSQPNDTYNVVVTGASGGGYENLVSNASDTFVVRDDADPTLVSVALVGPAEVAEGGELTFRFSVAQAPQSDLQVNVTVDGKTQTILFTPTSTSVDITVTPRADVAGNVDRTVTASVDSVVAGVNGNFEAIALGDAATAQVIDSVPSSTTGSIGLSEAGDLTGTVVLTFNTGADKMNPGSYAFSGAAPQVSGLSGAQPFTSWVLSANDTVLTGTTSGGDQLVLTLTNATDQGVQVTATLNGNLLQGGDVVLTGVVVNAVDSDGDATTAAVTVTVGDVVPTASFTSVSDSAMATDGRYTGTWVANLGPDAVANPVTDVNVLGARIDGQEAVVTITQPYDADARMGQGTLTGAGVTVTFTYQIEADGTYTIDLDNATRPVTITADEFKSATQPGGPEGEYLLTYLDSATNTTATAMVASLATREGAPASLTLYGFNQANNQVVSYTVKPVGEAINASKDYVGVDSNVLSSVDTKSGLQSEAIVYNPEGRVGSVLIDFKGTGDTGFGGQHADVLYITLTGSQAGQTQTIMLDSRYGDYLVNGSTLSAIQTTSYSGGQLSNYTVDLPAGWTGIESIQVTPGFAVNGTKYDGSDVKLAFGFTTLDSSSVPVAVEMNFNATVADADLDTVNAGFSLQTYLGQVVTGTSGADTYTGGTGDDLLLASAGADLIAGGDGIDTLSYALAGAAASVDLGTGTAQLDGATSSVSGVENLMGSSYGDTLTGNAGANVFEGGLGNDVLSGGAGSDTASYAHASGGVMASLASQGDGIADTSGAAGSDTFTSIENLTGTAYDDVLTGNDLSNVIQGGGGADALYGGGGADSLSGGAGADTLFGGAGDDVLTGGSGSDTFAYTSGNTGKDYITDFTLAHVDQGGDRLDLNDLLPGVNDTAVDLDNHISFSHSDAGVVITIDPDPGNGSSADVQSITLSGISLADLQLYAGGDSDVEIIQKLLDNGNLRKDTA